MLQEPKKIEVQELEQKILQIVNMSANKISRKFFSDLKNDNSAKYLQPAFLINPYVLLDRNNSRNDSILKKIKQSDSYWSDKLMSALTCHSRIKDFQLSRGIMAILFS